VLASYCNNYDNRIGELESEYSTGYSNILLFRNAELMDTSHKFVQRRRKARRKKAMGKCNNKVGHNDKQAAMAAIGKMSSKARKKGNPIVSRLNAYHCQQCGKWHVGSNKRVINWAAVK
jgi:hypothetical protein